MRRKYDMWNGLKTTIENPPMEAIGKSPPKVKKEWFKENKNVAALNIS